LNKFRPLVVLAVAQFVLGAGAFSLDRKLGWERAPEAHLMPAT